MRIVTSVAGMQRLAQSWRRAGKKVGLVPTMGYLHEGHLSLIRRARQKIGKGGMLVVSIYVNPTQFGPKEDFSRYPRDLARDVKLCRAAGVDLLFTPRDDEMYSRNGKGPFSTFVIEDALSLGMEGASRPGHFQGVATVVAKLFNLVQPQFAVFGAKDFQQAAIIKRMARDLNFPVKIIVAPTFREVDGLAMSSRNKYLEGDLRAQAVVLWRSIQTVRAVLRQARQAIPAQRLKSEIKRFIERVPAARLDYVEFFDPHTLVPASKVSPGGTHMALAVFIGKTRLIDNGAL
jgi:pantoate--beta-alanine ligase